MSYNIDTWKTKSLVDLEIPLRAIYDSDKRGWLEAPRIGKDDPEQVFISIGECAGITALLRTTDNVLCVSKVRVSGEGSGTMYSEILLPALKKSSGKLEAVLVWEGGDSITRLIVDNGKVAEENIEL